MFTNADDLAQHFCETMTNITWDEAFSHAHDEMEQAYQDWADSARDDYLASLGEERRFEASLIDLGEEP